jgi:hypothetical protein
MQQVNLNEFLTFGTEQWTKLLINKNFIIKESTLTIKTKYS